MKWISIILFVASAVCLLGFALALRTGGFGFTTFSLTFIILARYLLLIAVGLLVAGWVVTRFA